MPATPTQVDPRRAELVLQQLEQLPTLPAVAVRVLEVTAKDSAEVGEVVELIETDQSLTTRILHLCHRADLGVRGQIASVQRAVILLGFEAVRSAVLAVSVFQTFDPAQRKHKGVHFDRDEFWKHSIAVACAAEKLAEAMGPAGGVDPSEAFVCGLLHDLGKVALDAVLPKSFDRVVEAADLLRGNIADIERSVVGLDHMVIGKRLAERWGLPPALRDCIWLHGQMPAALPASVGNPRLVNVVTLGDAVARELHLGYSGNYSGDVPVQVLCEALGLSSEQVKGVRENLVAWVEPRAKALGVGDEEQSGLYQAALSRANQELGRVSTQLAQKNKKLAVRAKFFDALSKFHGEMRPDAAPAVVLLAVAQTAQAALDVPAVCGFSILPGASFGETVVVDGTGEVRDTSLADVPGRVAVPGREVPTPADVAEFEWLLSRVGPHLVARDVDGAGGHGRDYAGEDGTATGGYYWIPMVADGVCIGGVVWAAMGDERERLAGQAVELRAVAGGWGMALRTAQIRDESRTLAENLAETNRKLQTAQGEVLRAKMVTSIAEMAAGAAHEMNNPLAIISGRAQLLAGQVQDEKLKAVAKQIYEQSHKLTDIITELMDYAKPTPAKRERTDLLRLMDRAVRAAKTRCEPGQRVIQVSTNDVPGVLVDGLQIAAALQEIVENAMQATEVDGKVTVAAAYDAYSGRVVVKIEDDGIGMDEGTLKRAFDPFFSQKMAGRRRGMGLSKALRWIEGSGGTIRLESQPGKGTRAIILLPAEMVAEKRAAGGRKAAN
jgi:putative nucleotidyltransferase with HDIG domain